MQEDDAKEVKKVNTSAIIDKIVDTLYDYNNNPQSDFEKEVNLQAEYLKEYTDKLVKKDKKKAKKKFEADKKKDEKDRKYKRITDAYNNPLTLSGQSNPLEQMSGLNYNNITLNWWLSIAMYDNSGIFKIAVDTLSQDLVKSGITPNVENVLVKKYIQTTYNRLKPDLISGMKNAQLFGGAVGIIMFDTIQDYSKKPDINLIRKAKKVTIRVFDRWQISPSAKKVSDPMDDDFDMSEYYTITSDVSGQLSKVHHGYVMRFVLREAPKIVKDLLSGWGYSTLAHVYSELMKDQQLKYSIVSLINKSLLEVVQMSGMKGLFSALADPESQQEIEARLEMVNRYRNNNSLIFLDKEDQYSQFSFGGLSGLADLMETNKDDLCAILEESKLLLFGDTKGGLSGNAEAEYIWYQGKISGKQEEYLRRPLSKLIKYIGYMGQLDNEEIKNLDFKFNSIIPEKEESKMERFKSFVESLGMLKDLNIYDEEDVKKEVIAHADEYGVGIAPYKLKSIYDLQNKNKKETSSKTVKYKIKPLVKVSKVRVVPNEPVKVVKERLVPDEPVKTETLRLVPNESVKTETLRLVPNEIAEIAKEGNNED